MRWPFGGAVFPAGAGFAARRAQRVEFSIRTLDEAAALARVAALVCEAAEPVALGLAELLVNAIEHGNLGIDFVEKGRLQHRGAWKQEIARRLELEGNGDKRVQLTMWREGRRRHFRIRDEGSGFDWRRFLDPDPGLAFAPNGRGIVPARKIAFSGLQYSEAANEVHAWVDQAADHRL